MISATRNWLRRHRYGIAIGAGVVGGTYLVGQYVLGKINDARERMQLDRIAKENIRRRFEQNQVDCTITVLALLPTLFENVLDTLPVEQLTHELQQKKLERLARAAGEGGTASEASSLRDGDTTSMSSFQAESFLHTSQIDEMGQSRPRKSKAQLWNELKVTSITRALTLIYSLSLLTLLTRIQLNVLGRLNYLSSVVSMTQPPPEGRTNSISLEDHDDFSAANFGNDFETNRRFLTFSWFLLHRGYAQILNKVRAAVEEVFNDISPNEGLTSQRLRELILEVRKKVEGSTEQERYVTRWLPFVLPRQEDEEALLRESGVITPPDAAFSSSSADLGSSESQARIETSSGPLRQLLDESADIIDSPAFTKVHTLLLNAMFGLLVDQKVIRSSYPHPNVHSPPSSVSSSFLAPQPRIQELDSAVTVVPAEPRVKLANILAIMTRQAHVIGNGNNPPNEYVSAMDSEVKELESFAAVIYTSNLDNGLEQFKPKTTGDNDNAAQQSEDLQLRTEDVDEMTNSKLEGAWEKVTSSVISSRN